MHILVPTATIFVYNETAVDSVTSSSSKKLAIELGVGGGVALLVAIVLCIIGIAYYQRSISFYVICSHVVYVCLIVYIWKLSHSVFTIITG